MIELSESGFKYYEKAQERAIEMLGQKKGGVPLLKALVKEFEGMTKGDAEQAYRAAAKTYTERVREETFEEYSEAISQKWSTK